MFSLATISSSGSPSFPTMVIEKKAVSIPAIYDLYRRHRGGPARLTATNGVAEMIDEWDHNFEALVQIAEFTVARGLETPEIQRISSDFGAVAVHAPLTRSGKLLYAAQNYKDHVGEMRKSGFGGAVDRTTDFAGEKDRGRPYSFLRAFSTVVGPYDDIVLPAAFERIDWEIELALVIGRAGKHVSTSAASAHIAGYMITNDISCRSLTFRDDRPTVRSDWLAGKSHDTFAPMGPVFVPSAFVEKPDDLTMRLWVNDTLHQDGTTADMIFSAAEQIAYCSDLLTLEPGDILATGTPSGVGQGSGTFLRPGDVITAEIKGLGKQVNHVISEATLLKVAK
jgi:2,4-diketo-3-deoxy-L-fuconate hydrolase